jgi:hypothetical protein
MLRFVPLLSFAFIVIGVIALLGLMVWAARRGRPSPGPGDYTVLFRYNAVLRGFATFAAFGIPAGITALVLVFPPKPDEIVYIIGVYLLFATLGLPLFWETHRFYLLVTPDGIQRHSAWLPFRSIAWDDLQEVRFVAGNSWFVFASTDGTKIRASTLISGLSDLMRLVELRVPHERLRHARAGYERIGRAFPEMPDQPRLEARRPRY